MAMKPPEDVSETNGANLCSQCSVLPFNDKILGSYLSSIHGQFDLVLTAAAPKHPLDYKDIDYKRTHSILDLPALACQKSCRTCPLDYKIADSLPDLPCLELGALRGCEFCSLLRLEIMRAGYNITGLVEITLAYRLNPYESYGPTTLVAKVDQRPDTSCIPPTSTKAKVAPVDVVFTVETDDGWSPRELL